VITYQLLPAIKAPLINKYYKAHHVSGSAASHNIVMVARYDQAIVGVARLVPIDQLWFLTGVHVDESQRGLGIASELVRQLCIQQKEIYSFPFDYLMPFYKRLGFELVTPDDLPCELAQRFNAYVKQGRKILAMMRVC